MFKIILQLIIAIPLALLFVWKVVMPMHKTVATQETWSSSMIRSPLFIQSKVAKRDRRGRVQVMETHAGKGTCMAEITYEKVPRIHVLVISPRRLQNLGYLQINTGTEESLDDATLMDKFNRSIDERCLRLIIPGYIRT